MKKLSLCLLLLIGPALSQAAEEKSKTAYIFDFAEFKGAVKEVKISFSNPESADMKAETEATLKDGTSTSGEFSCNWSADHKTINCSRDDDGGSFSFISHENEYKLSFERFDLNDEGEEAEVAVISRKPAEADEVIGKKVGK